MLQCVIVSCSELQCDIVCSSVLQCVAVGCGVLQCVIAVLMLGCNRQRPGAI